MRNLFVLFLFFSLKVSAQHFEQYYNQETHTYQYKNPFLYIIAPRMAYTYTHHKSLGFTGVTFMMPPREGGVGFYGGTHFTTEKGRLKVIPEIGAEIYALIIGLGLSLNTQAIQPKVGITFINYARLDIGYSFPFVKEPICKGITLSIIINAFDLNK